ncbi:MAG: glycosyl transferase [Candidatus Cloacimonetes bacterium 4572_55]|nr:MAG: glycosyl transferase [Candidatus Cloacimonetes bacterium 4572_55]
MNFLFLNSARDWGGNEKWTRLAAHALSVDHQVSLAYRRDMVGERFAVETVKLPFVNGLDPVTIFGLTRFVRDRGINVLIPTKRKDYLLAGITARITNITNILRLGIVRRISNPYHRFVYSELAHGIIVNARPIKETLLRSAFMTRDKVRVVYNGLDLDRLSPHLTEAVDPISSTKPFPFLISGMGRVTPRKGFDFLMRGFARFITENHAPDAGLIIIGEGERLEYLQKLAPSLGIAERTIFTGFVDNPYPYLAQSDLFAMTSRNEGISNALLEAMYLHNAAITTRAGGAADIVNHGENGFLVDHGDERGLSERIAALYQDRPAIRRIARAGHETVCKKFSIDRMKAEIVDFSERTRSRKCA